MRVFATSIRCVRTTSALAGMALTCLVATGAAVYAGETQPFVRQASQQVMATVDSIDPKTRRLVVIVPSGEREEFQVDPEVRNLEQVKPGDRIIMTYHIGVAAKVMPPGTEAESPVLSEQLTRAQPGAKPGGTLARQITTTVKIQSVDTAANTVTFRRADGTVDTVAIESPEGQERARNLKPGDAVQLTYREAMAVKVEPASR